MILYKYRAIAKSGEKTDGMIFGDDYRSVYKILEQKQYVPLKISSITPSSKKLEPRDILIFFLHLDFQMKCGMTIDGAIESFISSRGNEILKASLVEILYALHNGESMGNAFERCGKIFNASIIGLLKSAQKTGKIAEVIENIIEFLKFQDEWKNSVKRAIAYPLFTLSVAIFVLLFTAVMLGPQIYELVKDNLSEDQIPTFTIALLKILPYVGHALQILAFLFFVCIPVMFFTKKGQNFVRNTILKIPKINELVSKICFWQFYKTLNIALQAKLDFIPSLNLAIDTIKILPIKSALENARDEIESGYTITESFSKIKFITSNIITIVYVGEKGNNLAKSFKHISENHCKEILSDIQALGQNFSAGLTIFTGIVLVVILCGLFYPIYSFVEITGQ